MPKMHLDYYSGTDHYSDGDVESHILHYIQTNLPEQYDNIFETDQRWAVLYHLADYRRNLLRWYSFKPGSSLLEVGAGMGACTPMFCQRCGHVTAVELSKRRATAIQARCREYDNLDIYVGDFTAMKFDRKFDYITVLGVLEYQSIYGTGSTPQLDFIKMLSRLLAPGGIMFIAIENKFGLKYWTGDGDDHSGIPFGSINDFQFGGQARTFDRQELADLLTNAGLPRQKFYYPLPDYKLPRLIFTDNYISESMYPQARPLYNTDMDHRRLSVVVDEYAVRRPILRNQVFPFFANSFLVECTADDSAQFDDTLFSSMNSERAEPYRIYTRFDGKRFYKSAMTEEAVAHLEKAYCNILDLKAHGIPTVEHEYSDGVLSTPNMPYETAEDVFIRLLRANDVDGAAAVLEKLYHYILRSSETTGKNMLHEIFPETVSIDFGPILSIAHCDMTLRNCFIVDGEFHFYDQEWTFSNIPASYVLYRALCDIADLNKLKPIEYWISRFDLVNIGMVFDRIERYLIGNVFDKQIMSTIWRMSSISKDTISSNIELLQTGHHRIEALTHERDTLTHERDILTHERDTLTHERDTLTHERDTLTHERDTLTHAHGVLTQEHHGVLASRSFRAMLLLRKIAKKTGLLFLLRGMLSLRRKIHASKRNMGDKQ